jgi:predicted RNA-binding Zn ribbon-like protein
MTLESPRGERIEDALFSLLLVILRAQEEGTWSRLKVCANPECGWAYYDRSRNQQGSWCDMATCGNRLKNRQLRARRA